MVIRKTSRNGPQGNLAASKRRARSKRSRPSPNVLRRRGGLASYSEIWFEFVEKVEGELKDALDLTAVLGKHPYYARPNVVKRAAYIFVHEAREALNLNNLEDTIDASRVANAGNKNLRTLQKNLQDEPYYWVLKGLLIECPEAKLQESDVTRFAQHLNYADRHKVPPEFLIGFLMQCGSLDAVYKRALDPVHREQWFIAKANSA